MFKRFSKYASRSADVLANDERLYDEIYVPEDLSKSAVEPQAHQTKKGKFRLLEVDYERAPSDEEGVFSCSLCPGLVFSSVREVRLHVESAYHKKREMGEEGDLQTAKADQRAEKLKAKQMALRKKKKMTNDVEEDEKKDE
jgi:hypothetical protein